MNALRDTLVISFVLVIFLVYAGKADALGQQGHQIVCQLAFDNLATKQQQALIAWITKIPQWQKNRINQRLNRDKDFIVSFADACIWADIIRDIEQYKSFSSWHYLNVKRDQTRISNIDCRHGCITQALTIHDKQWRHNNTQQKRLEALLFLSHWIGDIHQPLHVSFQSDRGGNDTAVVDNNNQCLNLHQVWDTCLIRALGLTQQQWQTSFSQFERSNRRNSDGGLFVNNVLNWANQSLSLTRMADLQYCHYKGTKYCYPSPKKIHYDDKYIEQNTPIIKQQILVSALRLKTYLKSTL